MKHKWIHLYYYETLEGDPDPNMYRCPVCKEPLRTDLDIKSNPIEKESFRHNNQTYLMCSDKACRTQLFLLLGCPPREDGFNDKEN
jgi:hypothetical protein